MSKEISDEFTDAKLGDSRRSRRLGKVVRAMAKVPAASIATASGGWNETVAAYRLLNCPDVTPAALLAPHQQAVAQRCAGEACVVVAQDTTEFDFTHMKELEGVGPLNDEARKGFFMHSLYAVSEQGLPLGVLDATTIIRDKATFRGSSSRKQRPTAEKESQRWVDGYLRTQKLARSLPQCEVVSVSDREGDIFEVFQAWHQLAAEPDAPRAEWIIRASQDRVLCAPVDTDEPARLFDALKAAPLFGSVSFEIQARKGFKKVKRSTVAHHRSARTVHQEIRVLEVTPRPPFRKGEKLPQVSFRAILAEETTPPEGEEPVRWLLLTSMEVTTLEQALRILRLYLRRWDIEVFHRVLKTGCRVERIQLETGRALLNALTIYAVIAWRILYLTHLGRQCPDLPCSCVFSEAEWKSTCAVVKRRKDAEEPTLSEFIGIVGKLGGHLGRKSDGPPGAQSIWQGLARIRDFAFAWEVLLPQFR